ncbi:MAG: DivIVA domain-containing protein [Culicoidibacterales bacterium]
MGKEIEFKKVALGGYDPNEVDAYIAKITAKLAAKNNLEVEKSPEIPSDFIEQFNSIQGELRSYKEIEITLREALEAAHKATIDIQEVVDSEARKILYDANTNADKIVSQALEQSISALNYIKKMRTDARVFQKRFKILIDAQNDFADMNLWDEVLAPIEPYEVIEISNIKDMLKSKDERK